MGRKLFVGLFLGSMLVLWQCATPTTPQGGARDNQPPRVDTAKSTPNLQVNFTRQTIALTFDEWVTLSDVFNQVLISPPLEYDPDISLKRKTVRVTFDERETLRPNATYTINFGESVKDLTEGNPAEDLRFVFSTGPQLDSLRARGEILDAVTGKPVEEVVFMLYENTADSVVRTVRPFYFAKTDSEGKFLMKNLKAGTFKAFALQDANLNYRYDQTTERIAFPGELVTLARGNEPDLTLRLFQERPPWVLSSPVHPSFGLLKLPFNRTPYEIELSPISNFPDTLDTYFRPVYQETETDTLYVYYDRLDTTDWSFVVQADTVFRDTVEVSALERSAFIRQSTLQPDLRPVGTLHPQDTFSWTFDRPIAALDTAQMEIIPDSAGLVTPFSVDRASDNPRTMRLTARWLAGEGYRIRLYPGAITDWYGRTNDTLTHKLSINKPDDYGNIRLTLNGLDSTRQYVLYLKSGEEVRSVRYPGGQASYRTDFLRMLPGDYTLRLIEDRNGNGRWDPGNYEQRIQPERILDRPLERLRANWDLEVTAEAWETQERDN